MKKFIPVREEEDYSYTAKSVCEYISAAYGEIIEEDKVTLGLSCAQEALEKLGYEYEEGDWDWPTDPRIPKPKIQIGDLVVCEDGAVGRVRDMNWPHSTDFALSNVKGYKKPGKVAWYSQEEVQLLEKCK